MFSLIIASLTAIAVLGLLWPLARAGRAPARSASAADFYRAQVAEIERDFVRGLVTSAEAESAKAEAARRLLAAAEAKPTASSSPTRWTIWLAAFAVLVFVPGFSVGLYMLLGKPELPDAPLTARLVAPPAKTNLAAETGLAAAVAKIEAHLTEHPDDARGWEVVAPVYLRLGRAHEAALAYAAVLRLRAPTPELRTRYGEALVYAAGGTVTAEARKVFEQALSEDPALAKARFFAGVAAEQDGNSAKAAEIWGKIAAEEPEGSPLAKALRERIAGLSAPARPAGQGGPRKGAAAIAALPEAERASAIRGMVERLASRLTENGQDLEGWLRLVRAYAVLDEREKAVSAVAEAKRNLSGDAAATARIDALARELGLEAKGAS
jgi:cytochrome c-type biogenesis protein CcmH